VCVRNLHKVRQTVSILKTLIIEDTRKISQKAIFGFGKVLRWDDFYRCGKLLHVLFGKGGKCRKDLMPDAIFWSSGTLKMVLLKSNGIT